MGDEERMSNQFPNIMVAKDRFQNWFTQGNWLKECHNIAGKGSRR